MLQLRTTVQADESPETWVEGFAQPTNLNDIWTYPAVSHSFSQPPWTSHDRTGDDSDDDALPALIPADDGDDSRPIWKCRDCDSTVWRLMNGGYRCEWCGSENFYINNSGSRSTNTQKAHGFLYPMAVRRLLRPHIREMRVLASGLVQILGLVHNGPILVRRTVQDP